MRSLVAEDEVMSRRIMEHMLIPLGSCITASNGAEALQTFMKAFEEGQPFNLVCLDIMMPEMNGRKALRAIREFEALQGVGKEGRTPIIMITSLSDEPGKNASFDSDCDGYLVKPASKKELMALLHKLEII